MKSIVLKRLEISNFKGIKELSIDFSKITNIYGENALGKTSIFDAFTWLMFDKDSKNRSTFDIKPLDNKNQVIRALNPTVVAVLEVSGNEIKLSKTLEEKWTKKRGEVEKTFTGNVTTYEINDVPVKQSDYKKKVSEIAEEEQFKLLTNPYYFSDVLNWKEARKIVLEVAGDVTAGQVIDSNRILEPLRAELAKEDIDTILKSKKATIKKLADKKKEIPTRINECDRSVVDINFEDIEKDLANKKILLEDIEEQLLDSSKANEKVLKYKEKIFELKKQIQEIEQQASTRGSATKLKLMDQLRTLETEVNELRMNLIQLENKKKEKEYHKKNKLDNMQELRDKFTKEQSKALNLDSIERECPTCKRPFEVVDIEAKKHEMLENFNLNKSKILKDIQEKGITKKKEVEFLEAELKELEPKISELLLAIQSTNIEINELKKEIESTKTSIEYTEEEKVNLENLKNSITGLENKIDAPDENNTTELKIKKTSLRNEIDELNKTLVKKDLNKELEVRKGELLEEEKSLGIEIAKQEQIVMMCEEFIKTRVDLLESNINSKFKNVTFKLFKEQVNGGIDETCEALVSGVPFSNANTAGQINAGLDIIDTLSKHFYVQVPIFIDNRESVNELIEIDSQIINLVVTKDNPLKIENLQTEGVM